MPFFALTLAFQGTCASAPALNLKSRSRHIQEIANAPIARLRDVQASLLGDGLLFDEADVSIYVPGLLGDLFGDAFAGALGKIGGRTTSPAKGASALRAGTAARADAHARSRPHGTQSRCRACVCCELPALGLY